MSELARTSVCWWLRNADNLEGWASRPAHPLNLVDEYPGSSAMARRSTHNQDVLFVSLMGITCARSPEDPLTEADVERIKSRLRHGLRGYSFFGMIEPAYYINLQQGVRYSGKRCMFWHLHALVWGGSRKEIEKRLRKLVTAGQYVAIADGVDPTHVRMIKQGRLPAHVAYLLKSPSKAYRVSVRDRQDKAGQPIVDPDGVVLQQFKSRCSGMGIGSYSSMP